MGHFQVRKLLATRFKGLDHLKSQVVAAYLRISPATAGASREQTPGGFQGWANGGNLELWATSKTRWENPTVIL